MTDIGNAIVTQDAVTPWAETGFVTRSTQVAGVPWSVTGFKVRATQVAATPWVDTAFRTRTTRAAAVAWVVTCASSSYVPPSGSGVIDLTATAGAANTGTVGLSWTSSDGGLTYAIYRGTTPGGEGGTPIASGITGTSYTDSGLAYHTTYYYKIVGVDACGSTTTSNEASAAVTCTNPGQVMGLSVVEGPGAHQATLRWTAIGGCTYDVYRSTTAGVEGLEISTGLTVSTWIDEFGAGSGEAYYTVVATNACGLGEASAQASVLMHCCTPWTGSTPACPPDGWQRDSVPTDTTWTGNRTPPADPWTRNGC